MNKEKNPYLRPQWIATRHFKLAKHPLCERCEAQGRIRPASVVHHLDGDPWNNDHTNLLSLCRDCHETIHERKAVAGCDDKGYPLSKEHHWNKE